MKTMRILFLSAIIAVSMLVASASDVPDSAVQIRRKAYAEDAEESVHPPVPHPHPSAPKPSDSTSGSASGSGGSSSGSSSGSSGSGSSSASSGGSGGVAGGGGAVNGINSPASGPLSDASHRGALLFLGVATVAGAAIAFSVIPKRRVETPDHPLKGSLNRRINLFSHLARHPNDPGARPPRRNDETDVYVNADEAIV